MADVPLLGKRGGGWVVLQIALMWAIVVLCVTGPGWPRSAYWPLKGLGVLVAIAGSIVMVKATRSLGAAFTPFPRPKAGELVETGPYAIVRHPVYSGGILLFVGISLALSPWALIGTAVLAVLWALKARVEERLLTARYPGYAAYCSRVRYRLIPFVY